MKKLILIYAILFTALCSNAQDKKDTTYQLPKLWTIGIKANAGVSIIDYNLGSSAFASISNKFQFAYNGGIYFNNLLNDNESFCFELLFLQMNGLYNFNEPITDSANNTIGSINQNQNTYFTCFSIPLYYKYRISKLSIALGAQINYLLIRTEKTNFTITQYGNTIYDTTYTSKNLSIAKFDYGPKLMLFYNITDKLSLNLDYYYGIQNLITDASASGFSEKNQQLSFGVCYKLY
jgi:outer membrane protein with beta-barrel domain